MRVASVSPRLLLVRTLEWALVAGPIAAAVVIPTWINAGAGGGVVCLALISAVAAVTWWVLRGRCRSWSYEERGDDLVVSRGVLFRRVSVVPYGRMQFVDVTAGPFERTFGLATVQLHTAAAASNARVPGLERVEADRLRDQLARLGEARSSGL